MKGSPILSTITATLLMAGAYLWLHLTLYSKTSTANHTMPQPYVDGELHPKALDNNSVSCYIEAHFSSPPSSFSLSDPLSGNLLVSETYLEDIEWSGEIILPKGDSAAINIHAVWEEDTAGKQHFIQLILSPDQMEDSTVTLRNDGEIDTTASFQLRK